MNEFPFAQFQDCTLSVIVPVFNEGSHIVDSIQLIEREIEPYFKSFEIIVVSDGSTDQTNFEISSVRDSHVRAIIHDQNLGKGAAVRSGFKQAKGEFILFIDGGLELHPREIKIFLGLMHLYEADIVIGSKRHPQSTVYYPWYRKFLSSLFQILVRILFKINVTDTQVGIKMFRREIIQAILPELQLNSYGFDLEVLGLASRAGFRKILEAPIRLDYFLKGSKPLSGDLLHTFRVGLSLAFDTIKLWLRLRRLPKGGGW